MTSVSRVNFHKLLIDKDLPVQNWWLLIGPIKNVTVEKSFRGQQKKPVWEGNEGSGLGDEVTAHIRSKELKTLNSRMKKR